MTRNTLLTLLGGILILCSCNRNKELKTALAFAKENAQELQKVLNHYQTHPKDSLKYRAACFLIENMPYHHFYEGEILDDYASLYEALATSKQRPAEIADSIQQLYGDFSYNKLTLKRDIQTLDAEYLISNIEWAFKVWEEQPWGRNISFKDFCEYILPYRVGDERPTYWREYIYNTYNPLLDSLRQAPDCDDPIIAAEILMKALGSEKYFFTTQIPTMPHVGPRVSITWKAGTCRELADCALYISRALGIPCGLDYMPIVGDGNVGHFWNFFLDKEGSTSMVELPDPHLRLPETFVEPKCKIYRTTFSLNRNTSKQMFTLSSSLPPIFQLPRHIDVTHVYAGKLGFGLLLPKELLYTERSKEKIIYLCLAKHQDWVPVAWTKNSRDLCFENVEGKAVYRVATYQNGYLEFQSEPFLADGFTRNVRLLIPQMEEDTVTLFAKCHVNNDPLSLNMLQGVFEGSNVKDFSTVDTLWQIEKVPERLINRVYPASDIPYRYVRYKGADGSYCNIAEAAFYSNKDSEQPLSGTIIGTPGSKKQDGRSEYTNVFDNDPYTSFDYKEANGGWSGLDLGKASKIKKIAFTPRNRDNFIRRGDKYELFYFNRKWISLGRQTGESDSLVYTKVPKGALLYLKNWSGGVDERIFTYENGKQVFW